MVTKKDAAIDWARRMEARFEPRGLAVVFMNKLCANRGARATAGFLSLSESEHDCQHHTELIP